MASEPIDISKLDKASVLAALYNASRPLGMGFMQFDPQPMTRDEAAALLQALPDKGKYFDYLKGRVMKVDLNGDTLDPRLYDRDNGEGAAQAAIAAMLAAGVNSPDIVAAQKKGTQEAAAQATASLKTPTTFTTRDGLPVVELGLSDVAKELEPKIKKAQKAQKAQNADNPDSTKRD